MFLWQVSNWFLKEPETQTNEFEWRKNHLILGNAVRLGNAIFGAWIEIDSSRTSNTRNHNEPTKRTETISRLIDQTKEPLSNTYLKWWKQMLIEKKKNRIWKDVCANGRPHNELAFPNQIWFNDWSKMPPTSLLWNQCIVDRSEQNQRPAIFCLVILTPIVGCCRQR